MVDARTLEPLAEPPSPQATTPGTHPRILLAIAATVAGVRLIDNRLIGEDGG